MKLRREREAAPVAGVYLLGDEGVAIDRPRGSARGLSLGGRASFPDTRLLPAFMDRLQLSSPTGFD
ncbi:MAG: hypothetical protein R3C56_41260 [Pirellulaceae bacterium]